MMAATANYQILWGNYQFAMHSYSQYAVGDERAATRSFRIFLRLTAGRPLYAGQRKAIEDWLTTENSVR